VTGMYARIRAALGVATDDAERHSRVQARLSELHQDHSVRTSESSDSELLRAFRERLAAHRASTATVKARADLPRAAAQWLAAERLPLRVVIAPALSGLDWAPLSTEARAPTPSDTVGLSEAALGIAETGSLVLHADAANPLTLAFLPEIHLVALAASTIAGPLEAAWAWQRQTFPDRPPQSLTLVSGPSRTADIEQTMYLGAHGPKRLHVLIYGVDPAQPKRPR